VNGTSISRSGYTFATILCWERQKKRMMFSSVSSSSFYIKQPGFIELIYSGCVNIGHIDSKIVRSVGQVLINTLILDNINNSNNNEEEEEKEYETFEEEIIYRMKNVSKRVERETVERSWNESCGTPIEREWERSYVVLQHQSKTIYSVATYFNQNCPTTSISSTLPSSSSAADTSDKPFLIYLLEHAAIHLEHHYPIRRQDRSDEDAENIHIKALYHVKGSILPWLSYFQHISHKYEGMFIRSLITMTAHLHHLERLRCISSPKTTTTTKQTSDKFTTRSRLSLLALEIDDTLPVGVAATPQGMLYNNDQYENTMDLECNNHNIPSTSTSILSSKMWMNVLMADIKNATTTKATIVGRWVLHLLHAYPIGESMWNTSLRIAVGVSIRTLYSIEPMATSMTLLYGTQWIRSKDDADTVATSMNHQNTSQFHATERHIGMVMLSSLCLNSSTLYDRSVKVKEQDENDEKNQNKSIHRLFGHALHVALHVLLRLKGMKIDCDGADEDEDEVFQVFTRKELLRCSSSMILHVLRYAEKKRMEKNENLLLRSNILNKLISCTRGHLPLSLKKFLHDIVCYVTYLSPSLSYITVSISVEFIPPIMNHSTLTNIEISASLFLINVFLYQLSIGISPSIEEDAVKDSADEEEEEEEENQVRYSGTRICLKLLQVLESCALSLNNENDKEGDKYSSSSSSEYELIIQTVQCFSNLFPPADDNAAIFTNITAATTTNTASTSLSKSTKTYSWLFTPTILVTKLFWLMTTFLVRVCI
jgi:hypothetical protein